MLRHHWGPHVASHARESGGKRRGCGGWAELQPTMINHDQQGSNGSDYWSVLWLKLIDDDERSAEHGWERPMRLVDSGGCSPLLTIKVDCEWASISVTDCKALLWWSMVHHGFNTVGESSTTMINHHDGGVSQLTVNSRWRTEMIENQNGPPSEQLSFGWLWRSWSIIHHYQPCLAVFNHSEPWLDIADHSSLLLKSHSYFSIINYCFSLSMIFFVIRRKKQRSSADNSGHNSGRRNIWSLAAKWILPSARWGCD